jgi:uncharacterized membrane protein
MDRTRWSIAALLIFAVVMSMLLSRIGSDGLDALAWMDAATVIATDGSVITFKGDHEAINWLNEHVSGSPVLAEASFGPYRCNGSRISIAMGLPDDIGWANPHEGQQRPSTDFPDRLTDLHELYTSTSSETKRAIINKYGIEYIIVGPLEVIYPRIDERYRCVPTGSQAGIDAFNQMIGIDLFPVFSADGTTILRVVKPNPALLDATPAR